LKELNLSRFKLRQIKRESGRANDSGSFRNNEEWSCNSLEGMIDAIDSLALASTSEI
jgi:hypothetical protein